MSIYHLSRYLDAIAQTTPYVTTSQLFEICQDPWDWKTVGDHVNYKTTLIRKTLFIFFQGSQEKIDWVRNFSFKRKPYKDMPIEYKIHGGFLAAWKEVEDTIGTLISDKTAVTRIIICGYSHGAALAALCHEYCWFHREDLDDGNNLIGFGFEPPRIFGSKEVPSALMERWANFTTFINCRDIVPHLPPKCFGFSHVGKIAYLGSLARPKYGIFQSHYQASVDFELRRTDTIVKIDAE
mgnify:FL=1